MATKNPDCTPGWVEPDGDRYRACCGCGWRQGGIASKTRAKNAQRSHRFPDPERPMDSPFSHPPAVEGPPDDVPPPLLR